MDVVDIDENSILKENGDINDKNAYRWDADSYGHATYAYDADKETYHIPTKGWFSNHGYHEIVYKETYHNRKTQAFSDGAIIRKNKNIKYIFDFDMLRPHMLTVWNESYDLPDGHFKNLDFLFKITLTVPKTVDGIMISNPMYLWDSGYNRRNGYGYGPVFNKVATHRTRGGSGTNSKYTKYRKYRIAGKDRYAPVRGIYRHGEQIWFGGKLNNGDGYGKNTHWFAAPCGTYDEVAALEGLPEGLTPRNAYGDGTLGFSKHYLLQIYDRYPGQSFDQYWDFDKYSGEERTEAGGASTQ